MSNFKGHVSLGKSLMDVLNAYKELDNKKCMKQSKSSILSKKKTNIKHANIEESKFRCLVRLRNYPYKKIVIAPLLYRFQILRRNL